MPFPLSYKGKIEAWVGDVKVDSQSYQETFIRQLADYLRESGLQNVYVLGKLVRFGGNEPYTYSKRIKRAVGGHDSGEVAIELREGILTISYELSFIYLSLGFVLFIMVLGAAIALTSSISWSIAAGLLILWLLVVGYPYVSNIFNFRIIIRNVLRSTADRIALDAAMSSHDH